MLVQLGQNARGLQQAGQEPTRDELVRRSRLEHEILRATGRAIGDHKLIENGDRILVAMSGGKDSYVMMRMLSLLKAKAPVKFELVGVNIDQGFRGFRADVVEDYLKDNGFETHVESTDFDQVIKEHIEPGGTACSLCARMRRGVLYRLAGELRCDKIALGHHSDDIIETLMLNLFFNGELKAMPIKLVSDDKKNTVIRPLGYVREDDIREYAKLMKFPIIGCMCQHCGDTSMERQKVKAMLRELEAKHPGTKTSMLRALGKVKPTQLLDRELLQRLAK